MSRSVLPHFGYIRTLITWLLDLVDALDRVAPKLIIRKLAVFPHDSQGNQRSSAQHLFTHLVNFIPRWHPVLHCHSKCVFVTCFFLIARVDVSLSCDAVLDVHLDVWYGGI